MLLFNLDARIFRIGNIIGRCFSVGPYYGPPNLKSINTFNSNGSTICNARFLMEESRGRIQSRGIFNLSPYRLYAFVYPVQPRSLVRKKHTGGNASHFIQKRLNME